MDIRSHLKAVFGWTVDEGPVWPVVVAAGIGMAVPLLIGDLTGQIGAGLAAAIGAFFAGNADSGRGLGAQARSEFWGFATAVLAAISSALIIGHAWATDIAILALAGIAAVAGGYSRPLAVASSQFVVFLVLTLNMMGNAGQGPGILLLIGGGTLLTMGLVLVLSAIHQAVAGRPRPSDSPVSPPPTQPQLLARWKGSLRQLSGWQYPIRLMLSLGAATLMHALRPGHHTIWIMMTVALICQRPLERFPVRTTQRAGGAALGVAATAAAAGQIIAGPMLVLVAGVLAGLRPWLRRRNYLAYSAVMTPLIILILDAGKPIEGGILVDRLLATVVGAALVLAANALVAWMLDRAAERPA